MEVHYFIDLWTLRTLNILQLTYYWCWITHMPTRIGLCTRKVVLELYYDILSNIHIFSPRTIEVHYFIELWTLRTLNILQLTYYWCWITHMPTRIVRLIFSVFKLINSL